MASGFSDAQQKINLSVLQQKDPYITGIADSASQVAAYSFNAALNEWEKTNIEGTLFVYTRSAFPLNGFMIINRLHLNDLIEPINKNLEFQLQDPFLLYKNSQSAIYGIWFYDRDECARIGQLMNSLVQVAMDAHNQESSRQRRASESDTSVSADRSIPPLDAAGCSVSPQQQQKNNVDILQMLSKAQDEYDKSKTQPAKRGPSNKREEAAVDPASGANHKAGPSPSRKANGASPPGNKHFATYNGVIAGQVLPPPATTNHPPPPHHQQQQQRQQGTTHINLDALFKKASQHQNEKMLNDQSAHMRSAFHMPPILLSNQTTPTVEEIERAQREGTAGATGAAGPDDPGGPFGRGLKNRPEKMTAPESPNTALRRTLKIVPPTNGETGHSLKQQQQQPTVVQALFSQQSGRLSSRGVHPRTSASGLFGLPSSEHGGSRNEGQRQVSPLERMLRRCTPVSGSREVFFGRQGSVDALAKPETFLATLAGFSNPEGIITTSSTTLLSPMAFQTPSKLTKCKSTVLDAGEMGHQPVTSTLKEASNLIKNHDIPGSRSPCGEQQPNDLGPVPITPLSKEQLRQALINLLKTDNEFVTAIHEAYAASLNDGLRRNHSK